MTETLTTELERVTASTEAKTIRDLMEANAADLAAKLPRGLEFEYFRQAVFTEMRRVPKLYECDPLSVVSAVAFALQLGLSPGPLGHCYLVPFKSECQFVIGYKGMIELAFRSGLVKDVAAQLVYEGDSFEYREGTRPFLDHVSAGPVNDRELIAAYAVARLKTGGAPFMPIYPEDWEAAKKRSPSGSRNLGPWSTDFRAMVRKTAVRRLQATMPQSPQAALGLAWDDHAPPLFTEPPEALVSPSDAVPDDDQL